MLTLDELKENYVNPILQNTGIPFSVFTDTGDFEKAVRDGNTVTEYVNGIFSVTSSSIENQGTDKEIVSISTELKFIVRVNDDPNADGSFENVTQFREKLSAAFGAVPPRFSIIGKDGKTYAVVAGYTLPAPGTREQRSMLGDSFTYSCQIYFAYLKNSLNVGDISVTIDGQSVPFLAIGITRRPSVMAALFSNSTNGESKAYAENAALTIDLTIPAFVADSVDICTDYIFGISDANATHNVVVTFGSGAGAKTLQRTMIFGESSTGGQGLETAMYTVSLIPYAVPDNGG